jgi:hypothetical protein
VSNRRWTWWSIDSRRLSRLLGFSTYPNAWAKDAGYLDVRMIDAVGVFVWCMRMRRMIVMCFVCRHVGSVPATGDCDKTCAPIADAKN